MKQERASSKITAAIAVISALLISFPLAGCGQKSEVETNLKSCLAAGSTIELSKMSGLAITDNTQALTDSEKKLDGIFYFGIAKFWYQGAPYEIHIYGVDNQDFSNDQSNITNDTGGPSICSPIHTAQGVFLFVNYS